MERIEDALRAYLYDTLGVRPTIDAWKGVDQLPYFIHDAFEFRMARILDHRVLLAFAKQPGRSTVARIRGQMDLVQSIAQCLVAYVRPTLASYERKRLIADKVPFIVPGNQMYLPDLGIDLREYFRRSASDERRTLSPATQAILITALLRIDVWERWAPTDIAAELGYSAMTLSRAVNELVGADIATTETSAGKRWMLMGRTKAETWEHARPILKSPVKKLVWTLPVRAHMPVGIRVAGVSALARLSSIAEPAERTFALVDAAWRVVSRDFDVLPEPEAACFEWQIWRYSPELQQPGEIVDPLSLTLSLDGNADDRVQLALDELREHFPW